MLPRVSKSLDGGLVRRGCQLASLITWSERLSQSAYSTAAQEKLSAEIRQIRYNCLIQVSDCDNSVAHKVL